MSNVIISQEVPSTPSSYTAFEDSQYVALLSTGAQNNYAAKSVHHHNVKGFVKSRFSKFAIAIICCILLGISISLYIGFSRHNDLLMSASYMRPMARELKYNRQFEKFIIKYNKQYADPKDKQRHLEIFVENIIYINKYNSQGFSFALAPNEFTDLSFEEFKNAKITGLKRKTIPFLSSTFNKLSVNETLSSIKTQDLSKEVNWHERGCVTPVKNQKKCGSCWAFSATGAVEGANCIKHGKLISLSEQQLVDCSSAEGNEGCDGGEMEDAFEYAIDEGGLCTEADYPYSAITGECKASSCTPVINVEDYVRVPPQSEAALQAAVALHGPVSVAIEADKLAFQFYSHGVFDAPCGRDLNHGVLTVGYGTDAISDKDYWLVKNSWGSSWGDKGYIKLARHMSKYGQCGILMDASYPIVA